MDYAEIAKILECSESALKSLLFRAYETLRVQLAPLVPSRAAGSATRRGRTAITMNSVKKCEDISNQLIAYLDRRANSADRARGGSASGRRAALATSARKNSASCLASRCAPDRRAFARFRCAAARAHRRRAALALVWLAGAASAPGVCLGVVAGAQRLDRRPAARYQQWRSGHRRHANSRISKRSRISAYSKITMC